MKEYVYGYKIANAAEQTQCLAKHFLNYDFFVLKIRVANFSVRNFCLSYFRVTPSNTQYKTTEACDQNQDQHKGLQKKPCIQC